MERNANIDVAALVIDSILNSDHMKSLKLKILLMIEDVCKSEILKYMSFDEYIKILDPFIEIIEPYIVTFVSPMIDTIMMLFRQLPKYSLDVFICGMICKIGLKFKGKS